MSCYIIGDAHAEYLAQALAGRFPCTRDHAPRFAAMLDAPATGRALETDIMRRILALCAESVAARYREEPEALATQLALIQQIRAAGRVFADRRPEQVIQSARCALHQMDSAPERTTAPIAVALAALIDAMTDKIVSDAAAVWGAPDAIGRKPRRQTA